MDAPPAYPASASFVHYAETPQRPPAYTVDIEDEPAPSTVFPSAPSFSTPSHQFELPASTSSQSIPLPTYDHHSHSFPRCSHDSGPIRCNVEGCVENPATLGYTGSSQAMICCVVLFFLLVIGGILALCFTQGWIDIQTNDDDNYDWLK